MDFSLEIKKITEELVKLKDENDELKKIIQKKIFLPGNDSSKPNNIIEFNPIPPSKYFTLQSEFESLLSVLPDVVLIHINGVIVYSNNAATELTGYTHDEFIGAHVLEFVNEEHRTLIVENIKKRKRGELINGYELKINTKSGEIKEVLVRTSGSIYSDSEAVVIILIDITENKRAERKLIESEEKFKKLAEFGPYAILMYQDDKWIYANSAAEKIFGYTKDELFKMNYWELVADEKKGEIIKIGKLRQNGELAPHAYELLVNTKQNDTKWVYVNGNSIKINNKNAGLISLIDITELKEIESKLRSNEKN